jgi:hypothetical protein
MFPGAFSLLCCFWEMGYTRNKMETLLNFREAVMDTRDPLEQAEMAHRGGRTHGALTILRKAIRAEPGRADLKSRLVEMQRTLVAPVPLNWRAVLVPIAITAGGLAALCLMTEIMSAGIGMMPAWVWSGVALVVFWVLVGLIFFAAMVGVAYVCLHAWFWYLRGLDEVTRAAVELALPRYFAIYNLEPPYSAIRKKYLG